MQRSTKGLLLVGVLGLVFWTCAFQVNENEAVIVATLGDPSHVVDEAGLGFKLPAPIETVIRVDKRVRVLDTDPVEYLTKDKKNITVSCFAAWSVQDPIRYIRSARDLAAAEARLGDIALAELGNLLGAYPLAALVSTQEQAVKMEDINQDLTTRIAERAQQGFGIRIHCALIKRLNYPRQNKQAVFRRMEAERQKIAQEIRSEGTAAADRIRADAAREAAIVINEATRRAEELRGEGEAEATRIYGEAYSSDPEFYRFQRTLEAYRTMFGDQTTIVLPKDSPVLEVLMSPPAEGGAGGENGR